MSTSNQEIDSLKVTENADGSFELVWDDKDPKWSWMNGLTNEQVQIIIKQAIEEELNRND